MSYFNHIRNSRKGKRPLFVAVCGRSHTGKTTFVQSLIEKQPEHFARPKSYTTRQKRSAEDSTEYTFVTPTKFDALVMENALMNCDTIYGHRYGIDRSDALRLSEKQLVLLKEVSAQSIDAIQCSGFDVVAVLFETDGDPRSGRPIAQDAIEIDTEVPKNIPILRLKKRSAAPDALTERFCWWLDAVHVLDGTVSNHLHSKFWEETTQQGYDRIAHEFTDLQRVTTRFFHKLTTDFWQKTVSNRVETGSSYLEIGPGRGWLRNICDWPADAQYRALESSVKMANANPLRTMIDIGSAMNMPYEDNSFDGVLGSLVDSCINSTFLSEAWRVLRPGGFLAVTLPAREWAEALRGEADAHTTFFDIEDGQRIMVGSICLSECLLRKTLTCFPYENIELHTVTLNRAELNDSTPPAIKQAFSQTDHSKLKIVIQCIGEKRV